MIGRFCICLPILAALAVSSVRGSDIGCEICCAESRVPIDAFSVAADAAGRGEPEIPFSKAHWSLAVADVKGVFTAPARWDARDRRRFALAALAVVGTAVVLDHPIREAVDGKPGARYGVLSDIEHLGERSTTLPLMAGFYLAGAAFDDDRAKLVGLDGLISVVIAHGLITSNLKRAVGRSRPFQERGAGQFDPFGGDSSFPSGHATEAFALASVVASHYEAGWIKGMSYGLAGVVGLARIRHDAHWASDVLAGALIGTAVGNEVVSHNREARAQRRPQLGTDGGLLTLRWEF